ncbi:hypothetical protein V8D89_004291 [Ganoderma adspersum]
MRMSQQSPNLFPFPDFASSMPVADNASLEGLSRDEIQAWALQKSEEYRLLSYTMLSLHNAAALLHTLPIELLTKIFSQTWNPNSMQQSLALTTVCRRWRAVFLSTPAFWAEAVGSLRYVEYYGSDRPLKSWTAGYNHLDPKTHISDGCVTMLLDRSASHPIVLRVLETLREPAYLTQPACVLPSTVLPHLNYVVTLHVETTLFHLHDLHQVLYAGISTLEELDVWADNQPEGPPDLAVALASLRPVPDDRLLRLFDLRMDPAIFFSLIAVRSLKWISLDASQMEPESWIHPPGADSRSLLRLLSRCPDLEYLVLEVYRPTCWYPPLVGHSGGTDTAVRLQSLKNLILCLNTDEVWGPYALDVLAALDPCIPPTASDNRNLLVFAPSVDLRPIFQHEDLFRTAHVTHLEIIPDPDEYRKPGVMDDVGGWDPVEDWTPILRAFPHLTHLTVSGDISTSAVVDALGAVQAAGHRLATDSEGPLASVSALCPALRYVTLGWEVPREICPKNLVDSLCDAAMYRQDQDAGPRVEQRCPALQLAFERRAAMKAQELHALEFYEYERQGEGHVFSRAVEFGELIAASRRDDNDLPCLERLRAVVGGPVVYRGYLLKTVLYH